MSDQETQRTTSEIEELERYRQVFFSCPDYVAFSRVDDGRLLDVNPGFERMLGWTRAQAVGLTSVELGLWPNAELRAAFVRELRQYGHLSEFPTIMCKRSGETFPVEISANVAEIGGEEILVAVVHDLTQRRHDEEELQHYRDHLEQLIEERTLALKNANAELLKTNHQLEEAHHHLLQSEKMAAIGQLAAGVAHEINNPIGFVSSNLGSLENYIQSFSRLLNAYETLYQHAAPDFAEEAKNIETLKAEADIDFITEDIFALLKESKDGLLRVKRIVQDLQDFSHLGNPEWQLADLQAGLDSTLNIINHEIKYKAQVIKEYGSLPQIECLPLELNQVFMNMLVNAGQAIKEFGMIVIRTGSQGNEVWVEFEDSGSGISADNLKRIFDPFFTTKPIGQGTGLGLSLSFGIVKKHHGRIEVDSTPGKGSRFRVCLPVRQGSGATTGEAPAVALASA